MLPRARATASPFKGKRVAAHFFLLKKKLKRGPSPSLGWRAHFFCLKKKLKRGCSARRRVQPLKTHIYIYIWVRVAEHPQESNKKWVHPLYIYIYIGDASQPKVMEGWTQIKFSLEAKNSFTCSLLLCKGLLCKGPCLAWGGIKKKSSKCSASRRWGGALRRLRTKGVGMHLNNTTTI
jgi:hypothetical protein